MGKDLRLLCAALNLIADNSRVGSPRWYTKAVLLAHYLERLADHAVASGVHTLLLTTRERMSEAMARHCRWKTGFGSGQFS